MGFQGADVQAIEGIDRYRHRTEKDLISEVVRRGIIPERSLVDLHALAAAYRPYALKALLLFNDQFPELAPLSGGITSAAHVADGDACACYSIADAQIIIDHSYFSKRSAQRIQHRGAAALEQAGNMLAGTVLHELWHHLQHQHDLPAETYMRDQVAEVTGDPRNAHPLAHRDLKQALIAGTRPYAAEDRLEAEAESIRMHFHGRTSPYAAGLLVGASALYGRNPEYTASIRARIGFGRAVTAVPAPHLVMTSPHVVGYRFAESGQRLTPDEHFVFYIRTTEGLFRCADRTIVDVHASYDSGMLVAFDLEDAAVDVHLEIGQPLHLRGARDDTTLPETFSSAPVTEVIAAPRRGAILLRPADVAHDRTRGLRTALPERAEQMLAVINPNIALRSKPGGITRSFLVEDARYLRYSVPATGAISDQVLARTPYFHAVVAHLDSGDELVIEPSRTTLYQRDGDLTMPAAVTLAPGWELAVGRPAPTGRQFPTPIPVAGVTAVTMVEYLPIPVERTVDPRHIALARTLA